jgi:hypothetical protein
MMAPYRLGLREIRGITFDESFFIIEQFFGEMIQHMRYGLYLSVREIIYFHEGFRGA